MIYLVPAHCTICIGGQTVLGVGCSVDKSLGLFVALCLVLPVVVVVLLVVRRRQVRDARLPRDPLLAWDRPGPVLGQPRERQEHGPRQPPWLRQRVHEGRCLPDLRYHARILGPP